MTADQKRAASGALVWDVSVPMRDVGDGEERPATWLKVGVAFQSDGRITVKLGALPLHSQEWDGVFYLFPAREPPR